MISLHKRRNYANLAVPKSLADELIALSSVDIDGHLVSIEMAGADAMSRLKSFCQGQKIDMPELTVRSVTLQDGNVAFSGVACWPALGGITIQGAQVHPTKSQARQAVAHECFNFATRHENGFDVTQQETTSHSSNGSRTTESSNEDSVDPFNLATDQVPIRLNLIDSPGHIEFNAEVTSALRICDGALVVVDAVEGKVAQTDNVVIQALKEGVRPVLMLNKVDRLIVDKQLEPEDIYDAMMHVVDQVNAFIQVHQLENFPDQRVRFEDGSVCFGSGYFGWSCSIDSFIPKDCPLEKYVPYRKALSKKDNVVKNIIQPIVRLHRLCGVIQTKKEIEMSERVRLISSFLINAGKTTKINEEETHQARKLLRKVMMAWLPAADALTDMIASALPSPVEAQALRAPVLYTGDIEDASGQGIVNCDASGPTVVFISKMLPSTLSKKSLVAYGRVFSGKIKVGDSMYALRGGSSSPLEATVTKIMYCGLGGKMHNATTAQAGQLVALEGVDKALYKAGTLCSEQSASPIKHMRFTVTPVVQHGIRPKESRNLTKMVAEMNRIVNSDSSASFYKESDTEEYILTGAGALHIEVLVSQLLQNCGIEVVLSEPRVNYRETVQSESSSIALAKSNNKHNRIWMKASPLSEAVVEQMANGSLQDLDVKLLGKQLSSEFGWDSSVSSRIWAVGPESQVSASSDAGQATCMLVDSTFGMQIPDDAKANIVSAFLQVVNEGVLVGSPMHGVRFDLMDGKFHQDPVHRRSNSIVPATSQAMKGAFLYAEPSLLEPMFKAIVTGASGTVNSAFSVLGGRGGQIVDSFVSEASDVIEALIPVRRSFGLTGQLHHGSRGQTQCSLSFNMLQLVPESEQDSIITEARTQKKLSSDVPSPSQFVDKL